MSSRKITKEQIRQFALAQGLDLVGFANIERFANAPERMHPSAIYPECKTVIVVTRRILRGNWRGIEEGTYWPTYTYYGYHGLLNSFFIPVGVYETACFIEDHGFEAVPYYPGVPETQPPGGAVRPGGIPPQVHLAIRIAGVAAGVGEIGWSKVFMTRKFGPRQRLAAILTDLEVEPDPLMEPNTLCDRCVACVKGCVANAIPLEKEGRTVSIQIEDKVYEWGDVDMGRCTLGYHGGDTQVSPFLHKTFPGYDFDVRKQNISEDMAYKLCWPRSSGTWRKSAEDTSGYQVEGHAQIIKWGGGAGAESYGIGGSRGCMRSCFNRLEKAGKCDQVFHGGPFIKRKRWLLPTAVPPNQTAGKACGGVEGQYHRLMLRRKGAT